MSGSPNSSISSSMMLRSHCRSTAELMPNYYYIKHPVWLLILVLSLASSQYYHYKQYNSLATKLEQLDNELKDKLLKETREIIKREINIYDADKTNEADFALESAGGTIVTTRCTKTYLEKNIQYSIDGLLPIYFTSNSPRIVIQPSLQPGECWSFAGDRGVLVIKLSRTILPTSFSYEHVRKELSPDSNIESAPKYFRVRSLKDADDDEGLLLGEYEYNQDGEPLQKFPVQNPNPLPTEFIEILILSNHGEIQYTCLYRFRVHGNKF